MENRKDRLNRILNHAVYRECLKKIEKCEKDRIFCHHDMVHLLDVARLAYILDLEEALNVDREMIYAAALLHDIGRHLQYKEGRPHEEASAEIAAGILKECGYTEVETALILEAIRSHRDKNSAGRKDLAGIIYRADKMSRSCFACKAEKECSWSAEKKNLTIKL